MGPLTIAALTRPFKTGISSPQLNPRPGGTPTRRFKIQATLGPASSNLEILRQMAAAGMDACRLNMSHCSHESGEWLIATVRRLSAEAGRPIAIGADLRGPKLRIGDVEGGSVMLENGARLELVSVDRPSDHRTISVDYPYLAEDVRPGAPILLNDGAIALRVEEVWQGRVICQVEKGGILSSRKGVNLPGIPLRAPSLTAKDMDDLAFAVANGADFLFLSYARSAGHVREVRQAAARLGSHLPLVAKIERQEGVDALAEIVAESDGICIARGDLGVETPLGSVPEVQREAVRLCRMAGKFAMMGGQVLSSMVESPIPLRAEVADIAATVREGMDALVLSDETAVGSYPVETVQSAARIAGWTEDAVLQDRELGRTQGAEAGGLGNVAVVSGDGSAARRLSTGRAASLILAVVDQPQAANWLSTCWGVVPALVEDCSDEAAVQRAIESARAENPALTSAQLLTLYSGYDRCHPERQRRISCGAEMLRSAQHDST
ncbi:MAG: pyruvate kinase [Chloroflexota bacterium]